MTTEKMSAVGEAATRAGQGQDGETRAKCSNSGNTELQNASPAPAGPAKRRRRKRRRSKLPKRVLRVTTYERLSEYLEAFAAGHFHLLILVGTGGSPRAARCGPSWACCSRWTISNAKAGIPSQSPGNRALPLVLT